MKVLVIGAGNMGLTFSEGMAKSPLLTDNKLMIHDTSEEKIKELQQTNIFDVYSNIEDCLPKADIIFLVIKPYHAPHFFDKVKSLVNNQQIFVSLMAGVTINKIKNGLNIDKVVRTMPNLPAKVAKGITSYTADDSVSKVELMLIKNLIDTTGKSIHVDSESFIDKSTGISGSGPAYVFYFMEAMMEAAKEMGFTDNEAEVLVTQTFEGAIEIFKQHEVSTSKWIDMVSSKGGTTEAAINLMNKFNVKKLIKDAAFAAASRAVELGK
ncbi:MAG: pyrroline-5-carboxylate reductase [Ichthyobacteriaceae bacterium]|nr:pyrroline-5-carboxylate reductase [Ichthyobacteriaceae bacterium]